MVVIFKPTHRCNLRCTHCYVGDLRQNTQDMTLEEGQLLLSKLPPLSEVILHGGEPSLMGEDYLRQLLHPFLGIHNFSMQTNLSQVDQHWAPFLSDYMNGRVSTSFDFGASLRPGLDIELWMSNTFGLLRNGVRPYVVSMLWSGNQELIHRSYGFFNQLGLSYRLNPVENIGFAQSQFLKLRHHSLGYAKGLMAIFEQWFMSPDAQIIVDPLGEIISFLLLGNSVKKCPFTSKCAFHFMSINPDGSVYPCGGFDTFEDFCCGNLLHQDLTEIRQSDAIASAGQRTVLIDPSCQACDYFPICGGGCRLEAFSYYHDINARTSLCADYKYLFTRIKEKIFTQRSAATEWWLDILEKRGAHDKKLVS